MPQDLGLYDVDGGQGKQHGTLGEMVMTKIINENIIKAIAEYAAEDIQRQYPNVDYLTSTVRMAVIDATNKVLDTEVQP